MEPADIENDRMSIGQFRFRRKFARTFLELARLVARVNTAKHQASALA
jgi:hypothetical protein